MRLNFITRRSSLVVWLTLWAASSLVIFGIHAQPKKGPLAEDEIYWIGSSYYYNLALVRLDVGNQDWQLLPAQENPPIAKYLIGLSLAVTGQHVTSPDLLGCFYMMFSGVPGAWGEGKDFEKRSAVVERMDPTLRERVRTAREISLDPALYVPARLAMMLCLALTSLLGFCFAQKLVSKLAALAASQALLLHPIAIEAYNHATADAVALLFSTAAAMAIFDCVTRVLDTGSLGKIATSGVLAGTLLGLACGAKMNSLVIFGLAGASFAAVIVTPSISLRRKRLYPAILGAFTVFTTALVVFIATNPAVYKNIKSGVAATFIEHKRTEAIQVKFLSGRLDSLAEKVYGVGELLALSPLWLIPLALVAVLALTAARSSVRFVGAWWMIAFISVALWIPFLRLRYAAPLLVPSILLTAVTIEFMTQMIVRRVKITARRVPEPLVAA